MHVRGFPALHHRLAHDLQVCVGLIVTGASVVPGGLAVLSLCEYGLSSGGHFVLMLLCGSGERLRRHRRGWERGDGGLYRAHKC